MPVTHREARDLPALDFGGVRRVGFRSRRRRHVIGEAVRPRKFRVGNSLGFLANRPLIRERPVIRLKARRISHTNNTNCLYRHWTLWH